MQRRTFLKGAALSGLFATAPNILFAESAKRVIKAALIGCGGRGNGACGNLVEAAGIVDCEIKFVAFADFFRERALASAAKYGCDEKYVFDGAEGYKKVFALDAEHRPDVVLLTTPLNFRAVHLAAAAKAGVHVFAEKGVAVDPFTVRLFLSASKEMAEKKLSLVAGTQRRHQRGYRLQALAFERGLIPQVLGGTVSWNDAVPWVKTRNPGESNKAYMCRNWLNFTELSGDHICEQHVHNIDIANWYIGRYPKSALAFGSRVRRVSGNQFDFFSTDFDYGDGVNIHSMCRQVDGCYSGVGEKFRTAEGVVLGGASSWTRGKEKVDLNALADTTQFPGINPYVQEHVDLLRSMLGKGPYFNEGETVAMSTACAVIARMSAYTGQLVRMSDILANESSPFYNMNCQPSPYDFERSEDIPLPKLGDGEFALPGKPWRGLAG